MFLGRRKIFPWWLQTLKWAVKHSVLTFQPPVRPVFDLSERELGMCPQTLTQFTSLPDTVSQIRREVHERRATVHLDKVPLLTATRKSRWQPADRRVNKGRKGEEGRGGGNGRTLSIIRVNDGRGGAVTCMHATEEQVKSGPSTGLSKYWLAAEGAMWLNTGSRFLYTSLLESCAVSSLGELLAA